MTVSFGLAIYFVCWWVVLFAVLPLPIGRQASGEERDPHAEASGAPLFPNLPIKFLLTTVISGVIFALIYAILEYRLITLDDIPF